MKHYPLTLSFLLSLLMVKGQNTAIGMSHSRDSSTGRESTQLGTKASSDSGTPVSLAFKVAILEYQMRHVLRDLTETHRRLDSLLVTMKLPPPLLVDSVWLKRMIQANTNGVHGVGTYPTYMIKDTLSLGPFFLY